MLTVTEAAAVLGISRERVRVYINEGRLPATRDASGAGGSGRWGWRWLVAEADLDRVRNLRLGRPPKTKE